MRGAWCLWAVVGFASLAAAQTDLERLVRQLGSDDARASYSAYQELLPRTDAVLLPMLVEGVADWPRHAQQHAVRLLAQRSAEQPKAQQRALWKKVGNGGSVFLRVATGVQLLTLAEDRSAAAALAEALRAVPEAERAGLVHLLYSVPLEREDEVFAALGTWLHAEVKGGTVAVVLARLRQLPTRASAVRAWVEPLAKSPDVGTRAAALAYLTSFSAAYAEDLAVLLAAEPARLGAIRNLLDGGPKWPAALLDAIAATLPKASSEFEVRQTAELLRKHSPSAGRSELRALLQDERTPVRLAALEALGQQEGGLDAPLLQKLLRGEDTAAALVAADLLLRQDDASGLEVVLAARPATQDEWQKLAEVLGRYRDRRVGPRLLELLDHQEPRVRQAAWQGWQSLLRGLFPYRRFRFEDSGYAPDAASRQAGIAALRAWWDAATAVR
jgi:HEAT repeat protein